MLLAKISEKRLDLEGLNLEHVALQTVVVLHGVLVAWLRPGIGGAMA